MTERGPITRRNVLQVVGAGSAAALAGCIDDWPGGPCQDLHLDLSTGTTNFSPDPIGTTDSDWRVVSSPDGTTGQAISIPPHPAWATLQNANWIDPYGGNNTSWKPGGDYVYEIDFEIEDNWSDDQCELRIHNWCVDDDATINLVGPSGTTTLAQDSGHTTLKGPVTQPVGPGQYTLQVEVFNLMSITGLLMDADVYCDCDTEPVDDVCDLAVTKEHAGGTVAPGDTTEFEITVCNDGTGTCRPGPVTVVDDLPAGTTFVSHSGSGWSCTESGGVVTCEHPHSNGLGPGDCLPTLTLEVEVGSQDEVGDLLVNCATVEQGDADASHKRDCAEVPVESDSGGHDRCRLSISKTHDDGHVTAGDTTEFEITVCNDGDDHCLGPITVTDSLPPGVSFLSHTGSGWNCTESGGVVTCEHPNSSGLAPGDCLPPITMEVQVGSIDETGDMFTNCASVDAPDARPTRDCVDVVVRPEQTGECDLSITKEHDGTHVSPGDTTEFTITVCNDGDQLCRGPVTVVDDLPAGLTSISHTGSGWSCTESGGVVTCEHPNSSGLAPGDCLPPITLEVQVGKLEETGDVITNCASIKYDDENQANNRDCVDVPVRPVETSCDGLDIKKHTASAFHYGQQGTYEIEICNNGTQPCDGQVTVTDGLPNGMSFVSASGSGWSVSESGGVVTAVHANSPALGPGDCLPMLTITVDVEPVDSFPGGSDGVTNCARLVVDGDFIGQGCVTHVITDE